MNISQKTIAEKVGVSRSTVAAILTNRGQNYAESVRNRVLAVAKELNYRPNASALVIRKGVNASTVALIGSTREESRQSLLFLIIRYLNQLGYGIRIYDDEDLTEVMNDICCNQINKVIIATADHQRLPLAAAVCREHKIRMVILGTIPCGEFPVFKTDNFAAMKIIVDSLVQLGHRRIALFCGPHAKQSTVERHNGFLQALEQAGLPADESWCFCEEFDEKRLFAFLRKKCPTALCGIYTGLLLKTENALLKAGCRIPDDISLVGFGNRSDNLNDLACLPVDCIAEKTDEIVRTMVDHLLDRPVSISPTAAGEYLFSVSLKHAATTAPPRSNLNLLKNIQPVQFWNHQQERE